jgi:hypothetical protein
MSLRCLTQKTRGKTTLPTMRPVVISTAGLKCEHHVVTLIAGLLLASQVRKHGFIFPLAGGMAKNGAI